MRRVFFLGCYVIVIISMSYCKQKNNNQSEVKKKEEFTDVKNYTGNAFVFISPEIYRARVFIIPVLEKDSIAFKQLNVEKGIRGRTCIQTFFGHPDLLSLINSKKKEFINFKACNLPEDSMQFFRVFIDYKNCIEIKNKANEKNILLNQNSGDSCTSKLIERTDSTKFVFNIYQ